MGPGGKDRAGQHQQQHEAGELLGIDIAAHAEAAYLTDEEPVELGSRQRAMP